MRLEINRVEMPLRNVFRISRGEISVQETVIVQLYDNGESGLGEATQSSYYTHSADSIIDSLKQLEQELREWEFTTPEALWEVAEERLANDYFALSALDQAAHDLYGKRHRTSVFERKGMNWHNVPQSSITVSIASIPQMIEELQGFAGWPIIKVKLGTSDDLAIIQALRDSSDAVIRVDANCAWTVEETIRNSIEFASLGVEFIEQPLPADAPVASKRVVFEESALPIIADESCQREDDVRECDGLFHGINIKLCKCGGLTPAFRMLDEANSRGLKTMVGCMIESEVAISAAAQLAPRLDYVDLDGAALLARQPAQGVKVQHGKISRPSGFGCGVTLNTTLV
ncbi:dipeptide epimerase [Bremerella alba]|uniref:Dipeptide epimerase n=1 Tax=Bremerella alba TaxID=980252 RepID=A0A7V9A646_9BACT|nr:dipeptide epimerase [Bremerella alba]MBA2113571.1 L-Ala-D/L-Glu epimerase [Bremerella alba]